MDSQKGCQLPTKNRQAGAPEYLLLVEHPAANLAVLEELRQGLGLKIAYLGKDRGVAQAADLAIEADVLELAKSDLKDLLGRIGEIQIYGVYTLLERGKLLEFRLAQRLGLPHGSALALRLSRDKRLFREQMTRAGLSDIRYAWVPDTKVDCAMPADLPRPFIAKPNQGLMSSGVQLVGDQDQWQGAVQNIRRLNSLHFTGMADGELGIQCEEFIEGEEYSIDSLTVEGRTKTFLICQRAFPADDDFQDFTYFSPPKINPAARVEIEAFAKRVIEAVGIHSGPTHLEVRRERGSGRLVALEVALRVGFGGQTGNLVRWSTGTPLNTLAALAALGRLTWAELEEYESPVLPCGVLFAPATGPGGRVSGIHGEEFLRASPAIRHWYLSKGVGDEIVPYPHGADSTGVVVGVCQNENELGALVTKLEKEVYFEY